MSLFNIFRPPGPSGATSSTKTAEKNVLEGPLSPDRVKFYREMGRTCGGLVSSLCASGKPDIEGIARQLSGIGEALKQNQLGSIVAKLDGLDAYANRPGQKRV